MISARRSWRFGHYKNFGSQQACDNIDNIACDNMDNIDNIACDNIELFKRCQSLPMEISMLFVIVNILIIVIIIKW